LLGGGLFWWLRLRRHRPVEPEPEGPAHEPVSTPSAVSAVEPEPQSDPLDIARKQLVAGDVPQALAALRAGLVSEPLRQDLRLSLLEVLANRGAENEFVEEALVARTLFGSDSVLWQLAGELAHSLQSVPPLFRVAATVPDPSKEEPAVVPARSDAAAVPRAVNSTPVAPARNVGQPGASAQALTVGTVPGDEVVLQAESAPATPNEPLLQIESDSKATPTWASRRLSLEERRNQPPQVPSLAPYRDGLKALETLYAKWEAENGVTGKRLPRKR
jgi:hypothetical protein